MMNEREQGQFIFDENCVVSQILEEIWEECTEDSIFRALRIKKGKGKWLDFFLFRGVTFWVSCFFNVHKT